MRASTEQGEVAGRCNVTSSSFLAPDRKAFSSCIPGVPAYPARCFRQRVTTRSQGCLLRCSGLHDFGFVETKAKAAAVLLLWQSSVHASNAGQKTSSGHEELKRSDDGDELCRSVCSEKFSVCPCVGG